ncbi:hypothetical protein CMV_023868 [Castanea mollissima]|uniref:F-box domain-containing protein n=1 Tax=Castanea mollissima TaxID=60419 RepID=A0A8J4QPN4_9ROSI|nr:hypothetical protein CMV_023868 [Castanea mollissima]
MVLQANSDINLSRPRSKKKKMVDDSNWRPWSELPEALLHQITKWLGAIDYLIFACVCRTWRFYALAYKQDFMASQPPLVLFFSRQWKKFCYFYSILDQRWYKALLPSFVGKVCFGISSGYLLMEDKKKRPDSQIWLMNPFTRHELRFPSPPNLFRCVTLASLATPLPEFVIICFSSQCLQFRRSTDVNWTLYNYDDRKMIADLAVFNVKGTADLNCGSWKLLCFDKQLLVIGGITDIEVYELNFLKMELVKIPNLGDQALFQEDSSEFSAISNMTRWEDSKHPSNCIYRIRSFFCFISSINRRKGSKGFQSIEISPGKRLPHDLLSYNSFWYFPHLSCHVDSLFED